MAPPPLKLTNLSGFTSRPGIFATGPNENHIVINIDPTNDIYYQGLSGYYPGMGESSSGHLLMQGTGDELNPRYWWLSDFPYQRNVTHSDAPDEFRFRPAEIWAGIMNDTYAAASADNLIPYYSIVNAEYGTTQNQFRGTHPFPSHANIFQYRQRRSWNKYTLKHAHAKYGRPGIDIAWEIAKLKGIPYWEVKNTAYTWEVNIAHDACVASTGPYTNTLEADPDAAWTGANAGAWHGSEDHPDYVNDGMMRHALRNTYGPEYQFKYGSGAYSAGVGEAGRYYRTHSNFGGSATNHYQNSNDSEPQDIIFRHSDPTLFEQGIIEPHFPQLGGTSPDFFYLNNTHEFSGLILLQQIAQAGYLEYGWSKFSAPGPFMFPENLSYHDQYLASLGTGNGLSNSAKLRGRKWDLTVDSFTRPLGFSGVEDDDRISTTCSTRNSDGTPIPELLPNSAICAEFLHPNSVGLVRINGMMMGHGGAGGRGGSTNVDENALSINRNSYKWLLRGGTGIVSDPANITQNEKLLKPTGSTKVAEHPFSEMQRDSSDSTLQSTRLAPKTTGAKQADFPGGGGGMGWHSGMGGITSASLYSQNPTKAFGHGLLELRTTGAQDVSIGAGSGFAYWTGNTYQRTANGYGLYGDSNVGLSLFVYGNSLLEEEISPGETHATNIWVAPAGDSVKAATWIDFMFGESSAYGNNTNTSAHSTGTPPSNPFGIFGRHSYAYSWANSSPLDGEWGLHADGVTVNTPGGTIVSTGTDGRGLQYSSEDRLVMANKITSIATSNNNILNAPIFGKFTTNAETSTSDALENVSGFLNVLDGYSDPGFAHLLGRRASAPGTNVQFKGHVKENARQSWRLADRAFGWYDAADKINLGNGTIWGVSQASSSSDIRQEWALQHGAPLDRNANTTPARGVGSNSPAPRVGSLDSCWRLGPAVRHAYGGTSRPDYISFYDSPPPGMPFGNGRKLYHQLAIYQYWYGTGYGHGAEFQTSSPPTYVQSGAVSRNGWGLYNTLADARDVARPTWPSLTLTASTSRDLIFDAFGWSHQNLQIWSGLNMAGGHTNAGLHTAALVEGTKEIPWFPEGEWATDLVTPNFGTNTNGPRAWYPHQFNNVWPDDFDADGGDVMNNRSHQRDVTASLVYGRCSPIERSVEISGVHQTSGGAPSFNVIDQQGNVLAYYTSDASVWSSANNAADLSSSSLVGEGVLTGLLGMPSPNKHLRWGLCAPAFEGMFWGSWRAASSPTTIRGTTPWHLTGLSGADGGSALSTNHKVYILRDADNPDALIGNTWSFISSGGGGGAGAGYNHPHVNVNLLDNTTTGEDAARNSLANTGIGIDPAYKNTTIILGAETVAPGLTGVLDNGVTAGGADVGWDVADNQAGYGGSIGQSGQGSHNPSHNYDYNTNQWNTNISTGANTYGKYVESTTFQDHSGSTTVDESNGIPASSELVEFNNQGHKSYVPSTGFTHHEDYPSIGGESVAIKTIAPSGQVIFDQPQSVSGTQITESEYRGIILGSPDPRGAVTQTDVVQDLTSSEWWRDI